MNTKKLTRSPVRPDPRHVVGLFEAGARYVYEFRDLANSQKHEFTIGRHEDCDICPVNETVSEHHCRIVQQDDDTYMLLKHRKAGNGVWANDIQVKRVLLLPKMCLYLGNAEFYVLGRDRMLPIRAGTQITFLAQAYRKYGTFEEAAFRVGKSPSTIKRAYDTWRERTSNAS